MITWIVTGMVLFIILLFVCAMCVAAGGPEPKPNTFGITEDNLAEKKKEYGNWVGQKAFEPRLPNEISETNKKTIEKILAMPPMDLTMREVKPLHFDFYPSGFDRNRFLHGNWTVDSSGKLTQVEFEKVEYIPDVVTGLSYKKCGMTYHTLGDINNAKTVMQNTSAAYSSEKDIRPLAAVVRHDNRIHMLKSLGGSKS